MVGGAKEKVVAKPVKKDGLKENKKWKKKLMRVVEIRSG